MKILLAISYAVSVLFFLAGLNALYGKVYFGVEVYNYVIDRNHAIAYFIITLIFVVFASAILVVDTLNKTQNTNEANNEAV